MKRLLVYRARLRSIDGRESNTQRYLQLPRKKRLFVVYVLSTAIALHWVCTVQTSLTLVVKQQSKANFILKHGIEIHERRAKHCVIPKSPFVGYRKRVLTLRSTKR